MMKFLKIFTIFTNLWKLMRYDINEIIAHDLDKLIENGVNEKYNDLIKKLTEILDTNSEIFKKLERETYKKRKRPDVSLRNMNRPFSKETREKMKAAWAKRKQKVADWEKIMKENE